MQIFLGLKRKCNSFPSCNNTFSLALTISNGFVAYDKLAKPIKPIIPYSSGLDSFLLTLSYQYLAKIIRFMVINDKYYAHLPIIVDRSIKSSDSTGSEVKDPLDPPMLVFFDYGHPANKIERVAAERFARDFNLKLEIVDIASLYDTLNTSIKQLVDKYQSNEDENEAESSAHYIPYRNTLLLVLTAILAESTNRNVIYYGSNLSEAMTYSDNTQLFVKRISQLLSIAGRLHKQLFVDAPLVNLTKTDAIVVTTILKIAADAIINDEYCKSELLDDPNYILDSFEQLIQMINKYSVSCYYPQIDSAGTIQECGKCGSCLLKQNAILRARKKFKHIFQDLLRTS